MTRLTKARSQEREPNPWPTSRTRPTTSASCWGRSGSTTWTSSSTIPGGVPAEATAPDPPGPDRAGADRSHRRDPGAERGGRPAGLLPGGGKLRPLHPGGRRQPGLARRVLHGLHPLPGRGEPGDAPGDVRVSDADHPVDRAWTCPTPASTTAAPPTAEAMLMALTITRRFGEVVVAGSVHPEYRQILSTFLAHLEPEAGDRPAPRRAVDSPDRSPRPSPTRRRPWSSSTPTSWANSRTSQAIVAAAHAKGALAIVSVDPISLGLLESPGRLRGRHRRGRGPVARQSPVVRRALPGDHGLPRGVRPQNARPDRRRDDRSQRQAVLGPHAPDPRAAHPPRKGDVSNICTNQGLLRSRACIYLAVMGPKGLRQAAELSTRKAHYAAEKLAAVPGLSLAFPGPFFKEFVVRCQKDAEGRPRGESAGSATTAASHLGAGTPNWPTASWSPSPRNAPRPRSTGWPMRTMRRSAKRGDEAQSLSRGDHH